MTSQSDETAQDPAALYYADVRQITAAARKHVEQQAYLLTGGSDGCSLCKDRTLSEKVAAGHERCAVECIEFKAAHRLAANLGEMWIPVSRAMSDPRMFQWVGRYDPIGGWEPSTSPGSSKGGDLR